jgi:hypothetical protein
LGKNDKVEAVKQTAKSSFKKKGEYRIRREEGHYTGDEDFPVFDDDEEFQGIESRRTTYRYLRHEDGTLTTNLLPSKEV